MLRSSVFLSPLLILSQAPVSRAGHHSVNGAPGGKREGPSDYPAAAAMWRSVPEGCDHASSRTAARHWQVARGAISADRRASRCSRT